MCSFARNANKHYSICSDPENTVFMLPAKCKYAGKWEQRLSSTLIKQCSDAAPTARRAPHGSSKYRSYKAATSDEPLCIV